MTRKVFYSFHYAEDAWRTSQVRNIGTVEGSKPAADNDWETVKKGGNAAIEKWIDGQLKGRSCTVVLVGNKTANRKWIDHEIIESWNRGMGVVGIRIHGLRDANKMVSHRGSNPFDFITHGASNKKLSSIVKCYDPSGTNSNQRHAWIREHLSNAIEEAIRIRNAN